MPDAEANRELPRARGRARSQNVSTNPLDCPITKDEDKLALLRRHILQFEEKEDKQRVVEAQAQPQAPVENIPSAPPAAPPQSTSLTAPFSNSEQSTRRPPKMNYQNYIDSPGGSGSNPRQAPPSPSQGMPNGMNGGMGMGGGMVGYPTPAGHQSDLNYVMSMVEELSSVLRTNAQLTAGVVDKMGKVREKAQHLNLNNDELIAVVASELNGKRVLFNHTTTY